MDIEKIDQLIEDIFKERDEEISVALDNIDAIEITSDNDTIYVKTQEGV